MSLLFKAFEKMPLPDYKTRHDSSVRLQEQQDLRPSASPTRSPMRHREDAPN